MLVIERYTDTKSQAVTELFHSSVHAIDPTLYSEAQKEAWAPTPPEYAHWARRLTRKRPYLAVIDGRIVGFMELWKSISEASSTTYRQTP